MEEFRVSFIPTENCNLRCYYCSRNCQVPVEDFCTLDQFKMIIDFIKRQDRELSSFEFFGGEPTTHPLLLEMSNEVLGSFDTDVSALTNLIKPLSYYMNFSRSMKFSCSYHSHGIAGDEWMKKVISLHSLGMVRDVKMIMTPDNEGYIADLYDRYSANDFEVYEIVVMEQMEGTAWGDSATLRYTGKGVDYVGEYRPRESYKGMMCCSGYQISPAGGLYHCRGAYNAKKSIGNIFQGGVGKLEKWHLCSYDTCDVNDMEFDRMTIKEYANERKGLRDRG